MKYDRTSQIQRMHRRQEITCETLRRDEIIRRAARRGIERQILAHRFGIGVSTVGKLGAAQ